MIRMKFYKFLLTLVASLSIVISGCSNEDEPTTVNGLGGTKWELVSQTGSDNYFDFDFNSIKFEKDGNCTILPENWSYAKWSIVNNKLRIVLGDDEPDDYVEGTFDITGKTATFTYSWYDYDGKWGGGSRYVMTLKRK